MAAFLASAVGAGCGGNDSPGTADAGQPGGAPDAGETEADAGGGADAGLDPLRTTGGYAGPGGSSARSPAPALPPASPFTALQMNLCDSGVAACYEDGQAIPEGRNVIASVSPDVVTLNEVCEDDVAAELFPAMAEVWPDDWTFWVFAPAESRDSGGPITCTDGQRYGIGILGHVPAASWAGLEFQGGRLENQQPGKNEMRAWACAYAADSFYGCATHLENDRDDVALLQCEEVMNPIVPQFWGAHGGALPTVVGGDLNLTFGGSTDVQDCVPSGWFRKGDGSVQHIMATDDFTFDSSELIPLDHSDHPAWVVRLVTP